MSGKRRNGYDVSVLPKWAQREIERLDREIERLEQANASFGSGEATKVHISATALGEAGVYVQDNARVEFEVDNGTIIAKLEHGRLNLMGSGLRAGGFTVKPVVANVVSLGFEPRPS